ncbi:MAG TPA: FMN-binding protein [Acidimicrobiales bacterium]|nr:FMN-binding protein [Acidimicrobiales bacterium]
MRRPVKIPLTLMTATAAGFVGVVTLHSPSSHSAPVSKVSPPSSGATTTTSPGAPPSTTTTVGGSSGVVNGSAVGPIENYGYGQLAVKVTIVNNRIVGLTVESLQTLESYSQQLEAQVVPLLKAEVLQAQGTKISALSGATYTSEAYAYSIQSALDALHFK